MRDEVTERVISAKKEIVNGSTEIWNVRLELLKSAGDLRMLLEHLVSPIEPLADNGNCAGCNCGVESPLSQVALPSVPAKK